MNYFDYRKKLGIGIDDTERFIVFKNKLINYLIALNHTSFDYSISDLLVFMTSIGERISEDCCDELYEVILLLEDTQSERDLISKYIEFCNCYNFVHKDAPNAELFFILTKCLRETGIQFEVFEDKMGNMFFLWE